MKRKKEWISVEEFVATIGKRYDDNHAGIVQGILLPRKTVLEKTARNALKRALEIVHRDSLTAGESFRMMRVRLPGT